MPVSSYLLDGEMSAETVAPVLRWLDTPGAKTLCVNTTGGDPTAAFALSRSINNSAPEVDVCLTGYAYSAGIYMLMALYPSVCVFVCPGVLGMLHYPSVDMTTFPGGKSKDADDKAAVDGMLLDYKKWVDEWAKGSLTRSEQRKLRDGKDVYFNRSRMAELFER